jgi:16S rRNA (cytosine1407-C5)-methyltransferase
MRENPDFDKFYEEIYHERWETLKAALLEEKNTVPYTRGLSQAYYLDEASVIAAQSLAYPIPGLPVLDACAAPGGKTLVISSNLPPDTTLVANELSQARRQRLRNVLDTHLPKELRQQVKVSGFDAAAEGRHQNRHKSYQAILLDAPCSSEAHVLKSDAALKEWTRARPKFLEQRQWALLSSAVLLLAPGGCLVYSTCSINTGENDGLIARLLKKYKEEVRIDRLDFPEGEPALYGRTILPDSSAGRGPIYVARVWKSEKNL